MIMFGIVTIKPARLLSAVVLAAAAATLGMFLLGSAGRGKRVNPAELAGVPRAVFEEIDISGALSISDFTGGDGRLFLLDRRAAQVVQIGRAAGGSWSIVRTYGRHGSGPGEQDLPTAVALRGENLVIADRLSLHVFDTTGAFVRTLHPDLPCRGSSISIVDSEHGWFGTADCLPRGSADTVVAALVWSADGKSFQLLAREARFTLAGGWGSRYYAIRALSDAHGRMLFGIGSTRCVYSVADQAGAVPVRVCGPLQAYRAPAPAGLGSRVPRAARWPEPMPYYFDRIMLGQALAVWRPISADSMILQDLESARTLLVAELGDFIGCRRSGCLWVDERASGTRALWLSQARLLALTGAGQ